MKMKFLKKDKKQDITGSKSTSKEIETNVKFVEKVDAKEINENEGNSGDCQRKIIDSTAQEENKNRFNVEHIDRKQCLENGNDIKKDNVVISSDVKLETTINTNGSSSSDTNKVVNGQILNGKCNSHDSEVTHERPFYFGIRSYLHNFYDPPDQEVMNSGEFSQDEFFIEPTKKSYKGCLFRTMLWIGINITLIGITALLLGHLVPAHNTIVGHQDNLQILDRSAITFNHNLELCRFIGLVIICIGILIIMLILLISKKYNKKEPKYYYVLGATIMPEMFIANPLVGAQKQINGKILSVRKVSNTSK